MVKHATKFPESGELVLGKVTRVNPYSAFVALEEYPGVEGMIHISEVARKWIKDIRDFVKEGQNVVARVVRVEADKGHVALSLKKVSKNEADAKLKEVKREQKAERMLELAAKEAGLSLDKAYAEVGFKLQQGFGEMWKGFESALTPSGKELLEKKGITKKWLDILAKVAEQCIEIKEIELKGWLTVTTPVPNGVEIIRQAILDASKKGIKAHYISAPKYQLSLTVKDAKKGERQLQEAAEVAIAKVKAAGGEGSWAKAG